MEDSRNALFVEPNAYIQRYDNKEHTTKKIIFQEPYECMPNYHMNYGIAKGNSGIPNKAKPNTEEKKSSFDIKSLLPILGSFSKDFSGFSEIFSKLNAGGGMRNILTTLMSNKDMLGSIMNMFRTNTKTVKKENKKTDFVIKNYTKVD